MGKVGNEVNQGSLTARVVKGVSGETSPWCKQEQVKLAFNRGIGSAGGISVFVMKHPGAVF